MNFKNNILNELISKDCKISENAAKKLINSKNIEAFIELSEKAEFIFDFILQKINKNFSKSVTKENYLNLFAFIKHYSQDFEDFITDSFVKFANEDLSDKLLELLEKGCNDEKCYATAYFSRILDPLALDFIKKNLNASSDTLKILTVQALKAQGDAEEYKKALEKLNSTDEEIAYDGIQFLVNFSEKSAFEDIFNYMQKSSYKIPIAVDLLYMINFSEILKDFGEEKSNEIFNLIVEGIPEIIKPEEYLISELLDYIKILLNGSLSPKRATSVLKSKIKFDLFSGNDSYTYDLSKNTKNLIIEIINLFKSKDAAYYSSCMQLLSKNFTNCENIIDTLEIIKELRLTEFCANIADYMSKTQDTPVICKCCEVLKDFNMLEKIDPDATLLSVQSNSAKALIESYFSDK